MKIFGITADSPVGEQRAALEELIDHGHSIFPVRPDKKPFVPWKCFQDRPPSHELFSAWLSQFPGCRFGLVTGRQVSVVDLDTPEAIQWAQGNLPPTPLKQSTPRGEHWFYGPMPPDVTISAGEGIDIRGPGGYVVIAPAPGYVMTCESPTGSFSFDDLRGLEARVIWMIEDYRRAQKIPTSIASTDQPIVEGERNTALTRVVGRFVAKGLRGEALFKKALKVNDQFDPPLEQPEVRAVCASIVRTDERNRTTITQRSEDPRTDTANANRLVGNFGDSLAFTPELGWLVWNGRVWEPDRNLPQEHAKQTAIGIYDEVIQRGGDRELEAWAKQSQNANRIEAMLKLAKSDPEIYRHADEFDTDREFLNVGNGLLDLESARLYPHNQDFQCTNLTEVTYDESAKCPRWLEFLGEVFHNAELIEFVQRGVGYSLSGFTNEQVLFFLCGAGANGKSIFLNVLLELIGSYGKTTGADTIMRHTAAHHDDLARLHKARVVAVAEIEEGARLREARVKDLTGEDTVAARFLYRESFEFEPRFKLWLRGNHKPTVQGSEEGIWRRIAIIPFDRVIPVEQRDPNLGEKLSAEMPGILRWAVEGFAAWKAGGLKAPPIVTAAVRDYREESDETQSFLDECCDVGQGDYQARSSALANSYTYWASQGGHEKLSNKALTARLQRMGYQKVRLADGVVWRAIRLKPNAFGQLLEGM